MRFHRVLDGKSNILKRTFDLARRSGTRQHYLSSIPCPKSQSLCIPSLAKTSISLPLYFRRKYTASTKSFLIHGRELGDVREQKGKIFHVPVNLGNLRLLLAQLPYSDPTLHLQHHYRSSSNQKRCANQSANNLNQLFNIKLITNLNKKTKLSTIMSTLLIMLTSARNDGNTKR